MKKIILALSTIAILLTGCSKDENPVSNIAILDAKVIEVKYPTHTNPKIVVKANDKTLELEDRDYNFSKETQTLLKVSSKLEKDDLIVFDFIVSSDLKIKAFSLSKNRQQ